MLFSRKPRADEFEAAALPHMNDIYRTAVRLLGAGSGADDVVQDVYLQAWKSFSQFELGTNCRAWLFKILFHTLHHYRRKWLNIRMVKESENKIFDDQHAIYPTRLAKQLPAYSTRPHDIITTTLPTASATRTRPSVSTVYSKATLRLVAETKIPDG